MTNPIRQLTVQIIACLLLFTTAKAQTIELLTQGTETAIRGLSVVTDQVIWVSGSKGKTGRSLDGGRTWEWVTVKGFEQKEFRDIEAWDKNTAVIMAIGEPAIILKTIDGGKNWKTVYENNAPGMFLDAMDFSGEKDGIVIGDPVKGRFFMAATSDGGDTWAALAEKDLPAVDSGEACFAASGTNIRRLPNGKYYFVSGGARARLFGAGNPIGLPLIQGTATSGANSIAIRPGKNAAANNYFVVVGGDFAQDTVRNMNCVITKDAGKTWLTPIVPPAGYRSCVEFISSSRLITCGTSGVDISDDGGLNWRPISKNSFHVCKKAKKGSAVFLAGKNGCVGQLKLK